MPNFARLMPRAWPLAIIAAWYLLCYFTNASTPSPQAPGWWSWWDQSQYYRATADLAHGRLVPENYWFGYPLLGVPFYGLMPRHPYLIPNLVLILMICGAFFAACRQVVGRVEAWLLIILFIALDPFLPATLVIPWNTLPAYATLYFSTYRLLFRQPVLRDFALCAWLTAVALLARPTEIFPLACVYLAGGFRLVDPRQRYAALTFFGLAAGSVAAICAALNFHLYGDWRSPYMITESSKFHRENIGLKAYQLLFDGTFLTGQAALPDMTTWSLCERFPLFLFCLPGAVWLVREKGWPTLGLPLAIIASVLFYLTYSTFANMPFFWTYSSYHYIWWIVPWLGLFTYLTVRRARTQLPPALFLATLLGPPLAFVLVAFGTKTVDSNLHFTSSYAEGNFVVDLVPSTTVQAQDIRLEFQTPPSYQGLGTSVAYDAKVTVSINGRRQSTMADYFMSQYGAVFDFSFLVHGLSLQPGDRVEICFGDTAPPVLAHAALLDITRRPWRFAR